MSTQLLSSIPPHTYQAELDKMRDYLRKRNLLSILDSLPVATSLTFRSTPTFGSVPSSDSKMLFLGYRNDCTSIAEVWANITPGNGLTPPVEIRDEIVAADGKKQTWTRAAVGMLRKPEHLHWPFCFMAFETVMDRRVGGIRNMFCALVLYYALAAGASNEASRWPKFQHGLEQGLRYIRENKMYKEWVGGGVESLFAASNESKHGELQQTLGVDKQAARQAAKSDVERMLDTARVRNPMAIEVSMVSRELSSAFNTDTSLRAAKQIYQRDYNGNFVHSGGQAQDTRDAVIYSPTMSEVSAIARRVNAEDLTAGNIRNVCERGGHKRLRTTIPSSSSAEESRSRSTSAVSRGYEEAFLLNTDIGPTEGRSDNQGINPPAIDEEPKITLDRGNRTSEALSSSLIAPAGVDKMSINISQQTGQRDAWEIQRPSRGNVSSVASDVRRMRLSRPSRKIDANKSRPKTLNKNVARCIPGESRPIGAHSAKITTAEAPTVENRRSTVTTTQRSSHPWRTTIPLWALPEDTRVPALPICRPPINQYEVFALDPVPRFGEYFVGKAEGLANIEEGGTIGRHRAGRLERDDDLRRRVDLFKRDTGEWFHWETGRWWMGTMCDDTEHLDKTIGKM
jgi:hypothetical protein